MARALRRGLTAEGFTVEHAGDGATGLDMARFGDFDAVILDIMLPRMSGYTVVKTLREEENWVPVMLLSAKDGEYDQADGLDYGADDYLTKPFSFVVLLARLRAMLRRDPVPRPTVLTAGEVSLNPASHEVSVAGQRVSLSGKEYQLVENLARAFPAPVPKHQLLQDVWGVDDVDVNVLEVYVGYVRRKLGRQRIETVRGVGYRLAPGGS